MVSVYVWSYVNVRFAFSCRLRQPPSFPLYAVLYVSLIALVCLFLIPFRVLIVPLKQSLADLSPAMINLGGGPGGSFISEAKMFGLIFPHRNYCFKYFSDYITLACPSHRKIKIIDEYEFVDRLPSSRVPMALVKRIPLLKTVWLHSRQ